MVAAGPHDLSLGRQHRTSASRAARTKIRVGRPHLHTHYPTHSVAHIRPRLSSRRAMNHSHLRVPQSPPDRAFFPFVFQDSPRMEDRASGPFFLSPHGARSLWDSVGQVTKHLPIGSPGSSLWAKAQRAPLRRRHALARLEPVPFPLLDGRARHRARLRGDQPHR